MAKNYTDWTQIIGAGHLKWVSDDDLKDIMQCFELGPLHALYVRFNNELLQNAEYCWYEYISPDERLFEVSNVMFEEIAKRIDQNEDFPPVRWGNPITFKEVRRCQRYINKLKDRKTGTLYEWFHDYIGCKSKPYFSVFDRDIIIKKLESIKRSDGYMGRRYECITSLVQKGLISNEDAFNLPKKLSKAYKDSLLHDVTRSFCAFDKLARKHRKAYCPEENQNPLDKHTYLNIDEVNLSRRNMLIMTIELLPNNYSTYQISSVIHRLTKEDVAVIMPMIAAKNSSHHSRNMFMSELKKILIK